MNRLPDWRSRFDAYLNAAARTKFRPGRHDCALFAAGAVEAMTGQDFARGWRGYTSLKAGQSKLESEGFADHIALAASLLPEIEPIFARVGDIAVVDGDTENAFGVVQGSKIFVLKRSGLGSVPLLMGKRAFRV